MKVVIEIPDDTNELDISAYHADLAGEQRLELYLHLSEEKIAELYQPEQFTALRTEETYQTEHQKSRMEYIPEKKVGLQYDE